MLRVYGIKDMQERWEEILAACGLDPFDDKWVVKTATTNRPPSLAAQRRNRLATFIAYLRFCQNTPMYPHSLANQLRIFDWIDERRIEMLAEGRPHWVPNDRDFEHAMWDCWDDLVKGI